jgi:hypothetical protein
MNDLKPETRNLLAAARGAESLSRQDRARIKRGVLMQVAVLGASATVGGGAAAMSLAAKITLVVSSVALLGGGAVSVWVWQRPASTPVESLRPPSATSKHVTVSTLATAEEPAQSRPAVPVPVRREGARPAPRRPSTLAEPPAAAELPGKAPATGTVGALDPELRVLRQAQDDLRAGLPAQALRRLQEFERRFGMGSLGQERHAIAAIAHCQSHPGPAARARAQAFLRSAPESPLAVRVRSACDEAHPRNEQGNENERPREP